MNTSACHRWTLAAVDRLLGSLVLAVFIAAPLAAQQITTVAGNGQTEIKSEAGRGTEMAVASPFGVEVGPQGDLFITEVGNHRILRLDKQGRMTRFAGTGRKGYSGDGGPATRADLNEPYEIRFDSQGNAYFVEMQNHVVRRIEGRTGEISTVAGDGTSGFQGDGGLATQARLNRPHSIALWGDKLFIADIGNHRIRVVELRSGKIETFAGSTQKRLPRDGELARNSPVLGPRALFVVENTLWVALREGHSIWSLDLRSAQPTWRHVAGSGERGYRDSASSPKSALFNGPKGIVADQLGNVFVVDTENHAIRWIETQSSRVITLAGRGPAAAGFSGDEGPAAAATLDRPHGICLDRSGNLYVGDTQNHRVRKITLVQPPQQR